jgi:phosphoribosylformylglycinamidine (FGAM) synthase-like enzyme
VTMDLKAHGSRIYIVGQTRCELGGSALYALAGTLGEGVPGPVANSIATMRALHGAVQLGLVRACHDCSEGGIAVAAAEMALAGRVGMQIRLGELPRTGDVQDDLVALCSETSGRFLVEVDPVSAAAFERALEGAPCAHIGHTDGDALCVIGIEGERIAQADLDSLKAAWQGA